MFFYMIFIGPEHDLAWIPEELPENVFMLLSTLPGRVSSICRVNIMKLQSNLYLAAFVGIKSGHYWQVDA